MSDLPVHWSRSMGTCNSIWYLRTLEDPKLAKVDPRKAIRAKVKDRFLFTIMDFGNLSSWAFEGRMNTPFYKPFTSKVIEYTSPKLREPKVWLWIVENMRIEQVYKIVRKLQMDYDGMKSH